MARRKKRGIPLSATLSYLLVATLLVTGVTFSGYVTTASGGDEARVAVMAGDVIIDMNDTELLIGPDDMKKRIVVHFECQNLIGSTATMALQSKMKNSFSYNSESTLLSSVDGSTEHVNGNFPLTSRSSAVLEFSRAPAEGVYRLLFKVTTVSGKVMDIPYNFIYIAE